MEVVAVVQARTGASRLPGKVLLDLGGIPVLQWVVRAAQATEGVDSVVVATTTDQADDAVEHLARGLGVQVVRGPRDDVLTRFLLALDAHPADAVVRLTADCPLLDPAWIAQVVGAWRRDPTLEYVATTLVRTLPRGMDVELVSAPALRRLDREATGAHRSHVTSLLYTQPEHRRLLGLVAAPAHDDLRITLDTADDLSLLRAIVAETGNRIIPWEETVALLRSRPDLVALNKHIEQKPIGAG